MSTITMTRSAHAARTPGTTSTAGARTAPAARHVRLTRRGRWVVTLLILGALLGLSLTLGSVSVATGDRGAAPVTEKVVVDEGDTLWGIATRVGGPGETRTVMYEIEKLNHLESSALVEGQVLLVPAA
jgi:nucleoid-associated protein YgaU